MKMRNEFAGTLFPTRRGALIACLHWHLYGDDVPENWERCKGTDRELEEIRENAAHFNGHDLNQDILDMDDDELRNAIAEVHSKMNEKEKAK